MKKRGVEMLYKPNYPELHSRFHEAAVGLMKKNGEGECEWGPRLQGLLVALEALLSEKALPPAFRGLFKDDVLAVIEFSDALLGTPDRSDYQQALFMRLIALGEKLVSPEETSGSCARG